MRPGRVVLVQCMRCRHVGSIPEQALLRFGLRTDTPIAAFVKRLSVQGMWQPQRDGEAGIGGPSCRCKSSDGLGNPQPVTLSMTFCCADR